MYCAYRGKNPDELIEEYKTFDPSEATHKIREFIIGFQKYVLEQKNERGERKYCNSTVGSMKRTAQSFYNSRLGLKITVDCIVNDKERKNPVYIPKRQELREILEGADFKGKTFILFQATTGMRIGAMLELTCGDVSNIFDESIEYLPLHFMPRKRGNVIGERITIVPPRTLYYLRKYLKMRQKEGEDLVPDTPLFIGNVKSGRAMSQEQFNNILHAAFEKSGIAEKNNLDKKALTSHRLRSYFNNCFANSGMKRDYIEYMMAHQRDPYNGAYWKPTEEQLIAEYRIHVHAIDPFFDKEKEELRKDYMSMAEQVAANAKKIEKLENEKTAKELSSTFSPLHSGKKEVHITSDQKEMIEKVEHGWMVLPLGGKRYLLVKAKEEIDD